MESHRRNELPFWNALDLDDWYRHSNVAKLSYNSRENGGIFENPQISILTTLVSVLSAALEYKVATQDSGVYSKIRTIKEEKEEDKLAPTG